MNKQAKQDFVSGLTGTHWLEIQSVMVYCLSSYFAWKWLSHRVYRFPFCMDFIFLILPILLFSTWIDYGLQIVIAEWALVLSLSQVVHSPKPQVVKSESIRHSITAFRGFLQYMTVCAILAVDFNVFPRRFAKTETFGTSLMDLGVGGYVFSSGLVAGPKFLEKNTKLRVWDALKSTFIAFLIGIGRILFVKFADYQEHVSEYGVHWNFFFTLGIIPLLFTIQKKTIGIEYPFVWSCLFMLLYSVLLHNGLETFILDAPRTNWISMNREGLFSLFGYYSLFLIACEVGKWMMDSKKTKRDILFYLGGLLLVGQTLFYFVFTLLNNPVSRRMANASYVLWVMNVTLFFLMGIIMMDLWIPMSHAPFLFESFNRNQLALFLIANILTGCVNMSIDTISQGDTLALGILIVYLMILSSLAMAFSNLKLKFS